MQKKFYQKGLIISATRGIGGATNNEKDILKIQFWLDLFSIANPEFTTTSGIDGNFGNATKKAVQNFQKAKGVAQSGVL